MLVIHTLPPFIFKQPFKGGPCRSPFYRYADRLGSLRRFTGEDLKLSPIWLQDSSSYIWHCPASEDWKVESVAQNCYSPGLQSHRTWETVGKCQQWSQYVDSVRRSFDWNEQKLCSLNTVVRGIPEHGILLSALMVNSPPYVVTRLCATLSIWAFMS